MSDTDDIELGPSKSQRKRDALAVKDLGETLVNLDAVQLSKFNLPESIIGVINETRRIKQHGARKRQLMYLGKQLRQLDTEILMQQLEKLQRPHLDDVALLHNIERWRHRLTQVDPEALTDFINQYPHADRQQLRQLIRNTQQESQRQAAPKSARLLFKYIRNILTCHDDAT